MRVEVDADELEELRRENARLRGRVDELIGGNSLLIEAARRERAEVRKLEQVANSLGDTLARRWYCGWQDEVRDFFGAAEQAVPSPFVPAEPPEKELRLGASIVAEEFIETMEALFDDEGHANPDMRGQIRMAKLALRVVVQYGLIRVDVPKAMDGVVDTVYTAIGLAVRFGVDLAPLWSAVHAANLLKQGGPVSAEGKRLKPPGWVAPDIGTLLREQGWAGPKTDVQLLLPEADQ